MLFYYNKRYKLLCQHVFLAVFNQTYIWSIPYLVQFYEKNRLNNFSVNSQPTQIILNTEE